MTILRENTFDGGTDEVEITIGNSGGGSGDAWNDISNGAAGPVFDADEALVGAMCCRLTTASYSLMTWTGLGSLSEGFARFYLKVDDATPASNSTLFRFKDSTGANNLDFQITSGGQLRLRERGSTQRYISSYTMQNDTWVRVEIHVVASPTAGHMEARLFYGANLHGTTPDEVIGNLVDNWDTLSNVDQAQLSITAAGQTLSLFYDEVAVGDAWVGPADVGGALGTPANFTFVKTPGVRELTASWDPVSGADHYEIEVQYWDGDSWEPFYSDTNVASSPVVLDDSDGVGWNTSYQARVRAVP